MKSAPPPRVSALSVNGYSSDAPGDLPAGTRGLIERRRRVLGPAYHLMYERPVELVRGEGVHLFDRSGRRFLDMYNNVASVGHCHPKVVEATVRQMGVLNTHTRYLHQGIIDYAEDLLATFPAGLETAMFTCTGSESNDLALRIARHITGRRGVIVTESAYHGGTVDVAACSPSMGEAVMAGVPWIRVVKAPDAYRVDTGDMARWFADQIQAQITDLEEAGLGFAAFLADSVFSSDGVLPEPVPYLKAAADTVHAAGGVYIADEVQPGFGRLGESMWGFQRHGLQPDIVTLGKPMGNGMPISGLIAADHVVEGFGGDLRYFNTFGGNPVSIAAAHAVLDTIRDEALIGNAAAMGKRLLSGVREIQASAPGIGDVRGAGLYLGVEFVTDPATKDPDTGTAIRVVNAMRERGVLISATGYYGNILKIRPPLPLSGPDADFFLDQLAGVIRSDLAA